MIWFALGLSVVSLVLALVGIWLARKDRLLLRDALAELALEKRRADEAMETVWALVGPDPTLDELDRVSKDQSGPEAA